MSQMPGVNHLAFAQLKPCIAPGTHKFVASPFGVVCERCGMTAKEARNAQ